MTTKALTPLEGVLKRVLAFFPFTGVSALLQRVCNKKTRNWIVLLVPYSRKPVIQFNTPLRGTKPVPAYFPFIGGS